MEHSLPTDIQQRIDAQLATGAFATEVDVLRNALEALERRQTGLAQLRQMIAVAEEDVAANRVGVFDRDVTKQDIRDRFARRGQSN
jgi:Arc/MetJ-type ribon-helix-helix transcriptional regulator